MMVFNINQLMPVIIIIVCYLTVPWILKFLSKRLEQDFPATKTISHTLSKIDKNKPLKKKIQFYCKFSILLSAFCWLVFILACVFILSDIYSVKYGDNSITHLFPVILLFSSLAPIFKVIENLVTVIFKIKNPKIDANLFIIYAAYYAPNKDFSTGKKINMILFNKKLTRISTAIFIPTLVLAILFAII